MNTSPSKSVRPVGDSPATPPALGAHKNPPANSDDNNGASFLKAADGAAPAYIQSEGRHERTLRSAAGFIIRKVSGRQACIALREEFATLPMYLALSGVQYDPRTGKGGMTVGGDNSTAHERA